MEAELENILPQYVRRFDKRFDDIEQKLQDVTDRMASIEEQLVLAKQEANLTRADIARIDVRLDRMKSACGVLSAASIWSRHDPSRRSGRLGSAVCRSCSLRHRTVDRHGAETHLVAGAEADARGRTVAPWSN
jgi:hypothetical protein